MSTYAVTQCARRATNVGGHLGREEKAFANRRYRRKVARELKEHGEDGDFEPKLYTGWDVI